MKKNTVAQSVESMETKFVIRAAGVILGFSLLILSLTFIVWSAFFQSQIKVISGINYYLYPVTVKMGNQVAHLDAFDSYSFVTDASDNITVEVSDNNGTVLTTRKHELTRFAGIAIDILSDKDTATQCYVQANITNLFYPHITGAPQVTEIKVLTATGANTFYVESPAITDTTLYPGNYSGNDLPSTIDTNQKVWGLYAVDCSDVQDNSKLAQDILVLTTANPEAQRQLYADKLQEISNSSEYNH